MTTDRVLRASQDSRPADKPPSAAQDAALRGAAMAWKPPVKPKPDINTYAGSDGALSAATKVGRGSGRGGQGAVQGDRFTTPVKSNNTGDPTKLGYQMTGESLGLGPPRSRANSTKGSPSRMGRLDNSGFLQPSGPSVEQRQSPAFMAATLAASRSASVSPNVTGPQTMFRPDLRQRSDFMKSPSSRRSSSRESSDHVLDTTPIPPTNSLIGIFEQNAKVHSTRRRPPVRKKTEVQALAQTSVPTPPPSKKPRQPTPRKLRTPSPSPRRPQSDIITPKGPTLLSPPQPRKQEGNPSSPIPFRPSESAPPIKPKSKPKLPLPPKPVAEPISIKPAASKIQNGNESSSSDDSFVSATDNRPTPAPPRKTTTTTPQRQRLTSASTTSVNSFSTINSMANAIVASSLATSRANSPSKQLLQPPAPPPTRRNGRSHLFHSHHSDISRTPSPSKPGTSNLRTTMRKPRSEEEDEGDKRRSKKRIMKKHPNKHAEGDRKRWRDSITEREKKRYEGVFASNRGLHVESSMPGAENLVCNLVVRDIFSRSRLHVDVLEEVYALVDRGGNGVLQKEEFVVGLWLVDQRLKGRKLPIRVSDHVWRSVGSLKGIKVKKAGN